MAKEFAAVGFPFNAGGAALGAGAGGVVLLTLAVVEFGDEITADGSALWAFADAAELLGISKRTLLRYAKKGLISPRRLSRRNFRWLCSDLEHLLNKSKVGDAV
jgi:predicted DNA-binding transcriptional regulator AlpA